MPYTITQNKEGHFVLSNATTTHSVCPCCDLPILERRAAEILAKNLEELDKNIEKGSFY